ncbi:hypothetical protein ACLD02_04565 [Alloalcanivorax sp. C16-2]|uniref:hypothetical protein n=1 Tax=Alloalcanivorax TaxID=3020832 RepID=UPI001931C8CF|nr:hypothetical protein [Alloalcanivorax marinus]MBL7250446.1 hypothetical protein [Alloalcanivorax marinus]
MTDLRPRRHLLFAALLLVAQAVLAWHAPSHIFDSHRDVVAQHDCQALHGHGMAAAPSLLVAPPPAPAGAPLNTGPVLPPYQVAASVHLARAPPRLS